LVEKIKHTAIFTTFKAPKDRVMKKNIAFFTFMILLVQTTLVTGQINRFPSKKPKLIVQIAIDYFRIDMLYKYQAKLEEKGFKKLMSEGTFCKNASIGYGLTQTVPGYASIATGTQPAVHGIISNNWYNPLKKTIVDACFDPKVTITGGENEPSLQASPKHLFASTFTDELKLALGSRSKVFAVAMDPCAAVMLAGHIADGAYYYDNRTGNFVTNSYYTDSLPDWVGNFNKKQLAFTYLNRTWETLYDMEKYTECDNDSARYEKGFGAGTTFPYNLTAIAKLDKKHPDYSILKYTPFGNTYVHDFAIAAIAYENLGKDKYTDYIGIGFNSLRYIAKYYGTESVEFEDAFLRLDKEIAHLLEFLNETVGKGNVLVVVTGTSGVMDPPEYLKSKKITAGRYKQMFAYSLLKTYLGALYGDGNWVSKFDNRQIFLNRTLIEDKKLNLAEIQQKTADFLMQFNGISLSVTATSLKNNNYTEGVLSKIQNSYNPKRSGDVMLVLQPYYMEDVSDVSASGSPYSYDTKVPLMFYGWKTKIRKIDRPIDISEIAPTLSYILEIMYPSGSAGEIFTDFYK